MKKHQTQHRQEKETKDVSKKELHQIRHENTRLKREVSRLKRELEKHNRSSVDEFETPEEPILEVKAAGCPQCGFDSIKELDLGIKVFIACTRCLWRKPKATGS